MRSSKDLVQLFHRLEYCTWSLRCSGVPDALCAAYCTLATGFGCSHSGQRFPAQSVQWLAVQPNLVSTYCLPRNTAAPPSTDLAKCMKQDGRSPCAGASALRGLATRSEHPAGVELTDAEPVAPGAEAPEEDQVGAAFERMILEAYRLMQEGRLDHAEMLVAEGVSSAEAALGHDNIGLAPLIDQLALLQFFQSRMKEAEENARRSLALAVAARDAAEAAAVAEAGLEPGAGEGASPGMAMCQLRLGSVCLGVQKREEALQLLSEAWAALHAVFGPDFAATAEALFYLTIAELPPAALTPGHLERAESVFVQALRVMQSNPAAGGQLAAAALREHHRLMDQHLLSRNWALTDALFEQELRLQAQVDPLGKGMSLVQYQYATLLYVRDQTAAAEELCLKSLALARAHFKDAHEQVVLRQHRLGAIAAYGGDLEGAATALAASKAAFIRLLGPENPLAGEAIATLALVQLRQIEASRGSADVFTRVLNPGRQRALVAEARNGLRAMQKGFGHDHLLTVKLMDSLQPFLTSDDAQ